MSISFQEKSDILAQYATKPGDTGSVEIQVAILTKRIQNLTLHMQQHMKDFHCRRGLLMLVGQRRKLLDYAKKKSEKRYKDLIERLQIRR